MAITTFYSENEPNVLPSDKILNELIQECVKLDGRVWRLEERKFLKKSTFFSTISFRKPEFVTLYSLALELYPKIGEYQIMNFRCDNSGTSINTYVTADVMTAYLYGYLNGRKSFKESKN